MRSNWGCLVLAVLLLAVAGRAGAQGTAEHAAATSTVGAAATPVKTTTKVVSSTQNKNKFGHLEVRGKESPEVENRRALEERAGEDAAKLLLRSTPTRAQVWIDGKLVGKTPLLLIVAPGSYQVEMRGARMQFAREEVDLLPEERREVVVSLAPRYPAHLRLR